MSDLTPPSRAAVLTAVGWDVASVMLLGAAAIAVYSGHLWFALAFSVVSAASAFVGSSRTEDVLQGGMRGRSRMAAVVLCRVARFLIVPVGVAVLLAAPTWRPNPAATAAAPLTEVIQRAGGHELCSGGDDGRPGPSDNRQPTYYAVYTAPQDVGQLQRSLLRAANDRRYDISQGAGGDYLDGDDARVAVHTDLHGVPGACGRLSQTVTAQEGQQLITLRLVYANSYWLDHRP